jgi:DNA repair photolyase
MFYRGLMGNAVTFREVSCKSALNHVQGMPFEWSLNPYRGCAHGCTYCYARAYFAIADRDPGDGFDKVIEVKTNFVDVLRQELRRPKSGTVALGTATDPYQPCEGRYRVTRGTLEALVERPVPLAIVTKNPMVVRDADLLAKLAERVDVVVHFSVTTLDQALWRKIEPRTAPPEARLRALQELRRRGIRAGVLCAPVIPRLTDHQASITAVARAARDHGAVSFGSRPLKLDPGTKEVWFAFVAAQFPELLPRYVDGYRGGPHADPAYIREVERRVEIARQTVRFPEARYYTSRADSNAPVQLALAM